VVWCGWGGQDWDSAVPHDFAATSLSAETGHAIGRETVLAAFCNALEEHMACDWPEVLRRYTAVDGLLGKAVRVHHAARGVSHPDDYVATALRFDAGGGLVVLAPDGRERTLAGAPPHPRASRPLRPAPSAHVTHSHTRARI